MKKLILLLWLVLPFLCYAGSRVFPEPELSLKSLILSLAGLIWIPSWKGLNNLRLFLTFCIISLSFIADGDRFFLFIYGAFSFFLWDLSLLLKECYESAENPHIKQDFYRRGFYTFLTVAVILTTLLCVSFPPLKMHVLIIMTLSLISFFLIRKLFTRMS